MTDTDVHANLLCGHLDGRSRKASLDKSQDDEQVVTHSSITNGTEKPSQKSAESHQNGINGDEQPAGKKRGRKSKAERVETDTKKHRSKSIVGRSSLIQRSTTWYLSRHHRKVRRDLAVHLSTNHRLPRPNARALASQQQ